MQYDLMVKLKAMGFNRLGDINTREKLPLVMTSVLYFQTLIRPIIDDNLGLLEDQVLSKIDPQKHSKISNQTILEVKNQVVDLRGAKVRSMNKIQQFLSQTHDLSGNNRVNLEPADNTFKSEILHIVDRLKSQFYNWRNDRVFLRNYKNDVKMNMMARVLSKMSRLKNPQDILDAYAGLYEMFIDPAHNDEFRFVRPEDVDTNGYNDTPRRELMFKLFEAILGKILRGVELEEINDKARLTNLVDLWLSQNENLGYSKPAILGKHVNLNLKALLEFDAFSRYKAKQIKVKKFPSGYVDIKLLITDTKVAKDIKGHWISDTIEIQLQDEATNKNKKDEEKEKLFEKRKEVQTKFNAVLVANGIDGVSKNQQVAILSNLDPALDHLKSLEYLKNFGVKPESISAIDTLIKDTIKVYGDSGLRYTDKSTNDNISNDKPDSKDTLYSLSLQFRQLLARSVEIFSPGSFMQTYQDALEFAQELDPKFQDITTIDMGFGEKSVADVRLLVQEEKEKNYLERLRRNQLEAERMKIGYQLAQRSRLDNQYRLNNGFSRPSYIPPLPPV